MSTKLKALTLGLAAFFGVSAIGISAPAVLADDITATCTQWQVDQGLCDAGLRTLTLNIINWVLLFLGLIATGFLIYGGFLYITSAGNDENINKAKKLITYAAIGIVVILISAVLVNALVDMLSSSRIDQ
ncbi:pilin, partial [Patescibacteria group bacterium]|nr:pilin [Patescibacteria group bacterium]